MLRRFGTGPTGGCRLPAACVPRFGDRGGTRRAGRTGFDEQARGGLAVLQVFALFLRVFAMLAFGGIGGIGGIHQSAPRT
jgi:hypothetical protein